MYQHIFNMINNFLKRQILKTPTIDLNIHNVTKISMMSFKMYKNKIRHTFFGLTYLIQL